MASATIIRLADDIELLGNNEEELQIEFVRPWKIEFDPKKLTWYGN